MNTLHERLKQADKSSKILNARILNVGKTVRITKKQFIYYDHSLNMDIFYCISCKYEHVINEFNFCPNCGIKISFSKSIREGN